MCKFGTCKKQVNFLTGTVPYFVRTRVNTRTVQFFAQIAQLWPGIKYRDWPKICTDPCKHHCSRICTDSCKQAVQEQNSSAQKFVWTRVNGVSVGRVLVHRFRRGRGYEFHSSLNFFQASVNISQLYKLVYTLN